MRALLEQDLDLALLCLLVLPPPQRAASLMRWLCEAHMADKIRKRLHCAHTPWGDGTLAGRLCHVARHKVLRRHDAQSLAALHDLAVTLDLWRRGQVARGKGLGHLGDLDRACRGGAGGQGHASRPDETGAGRNSALNLPKRSSSHGHCPQAKSRRTRSRLASHL